MEGVFVYICLIAMPFLDFGILCEPKTRRFLRKEMCYDLVFSIHEESFAALARFEKKP